MTVLGSSIGGGGKFHRGGGECHPGGGEVAQPGETVWSWWEKFEMRREKLHRGGREELKKEEKLVTAVSKD